jgi:hypothetical protein
VSRPSGAAPAARVRSPEPRRRPASPSERSRCGPGARAIHARVGRWSFAYLSVLVTCVGTGPLAAQDGANPDRDPAHFAAVLLAADSAYLRLWARFGDVDAIQRRLGVDPRPITLARGWAMPAYEELADGSVAAVRRQAIREMGVEESADADLRCVLFRWDGEHRAASSERQRRCPALDRLWVYASPTNRTGEATDGRKLWSTRFYGTRAANQDVLVEVTSSRHGDGLEVVDVRMIRGVMAGTLQRNAARTPADVGSYATADYVRGETR